VYDISGAIFSGDVAAASAAATLFLSLSPLRFVGFSFSYSLVTQFRNPAFT